MKEELEQRLTNRNDPEKKKLRKILPKDRFEALKSWCEENNKLSPQKEEYNDIKIGSFLNHLLGGRYNCKNQ